MLALKIIAVTLGAAFAAFGYLIFFRKKYSLINGFVAGRKNEACARRVGLVELVVGIACLAAGIALIVFA